jgi:hypothetical protein
MSELGSLGKWRAAMKEEHGAHRDEALLELLK